MDNLLARRSRCSRSISGAIGAFRATSFLIAERLLTSLRGTVSRRHRRQGILRTILACEPDGKRQRSTPPLALRAAREAIVLLKNKDNFLPLKHAPEKIAVIGPNADNLYALVGNYSGTPSKPVTMLEGLRKRNPTSKVVYVEGTGLVGPVSKAIPHSALCTDTSCTEHGRKADYFANMTLEGTSPTLTRTDDAVDFAWVDTGISPQLLKNYSARWTGVLTPPEAGDYLVGFTGQDGHRLWLDGNLMVEDWNIHHPASRQTKKVHLEKDHLYPIKIEYFQNIRSSEARLVWSLPDQGGQEALNAAGNADLVVMVLGLSPRIEGEEIEGRCGGFFRWRSYTY